MTAENTIEDILREGLDDVGRMISMLGVSQSTRLRGIDLSDCDLSGSTFRKLDFQSANFSRSDLTEVSFEDCNLTDAVFEGVNLDAVKFVNCTGDIGRQSISHLSDEQIEFELLQQAPR